MTAILRIMLLLASLVAPAWAGDAYVVFWFDTEDYLTPESDGAALRVARILTERGIRGTFKITGETARVLEKRGRRDVIAALRRHDIGYHTDFHSVPPAPATYLNAMAWDDGVEEFIRREQQGARDVARIFQRPLSSYGQPGNSWAYRTRNVEQWNAEHLNAGRRSVVLLFHCSAFHCSEFEALPTSTPCSSRYARRRVPAV